MKKYANAFSQGNQTQIVLSDEQLQLLAKVLNEQSKNKKE